jgi:hypothetical protein
MIPLSFPPTPLSLNKEGEQYKVRCLIRKKWLVLTPEEWVRQHVIGYLIHVKKIPSGNISVEKALTYNQRLKRWDIATFDSEGNPSILVECKRTTVPCTPEVMVQISAYQKVVQAEKLIITNGLSCHIYHEGRWTEGVDKI